MSIIVATTKSFSIVLFHILNGPYSVPVSILVFNVEIITETSFIHDLECGLGVVNSVDIWIYFVRILFNDRTRLNMVDTVGYRIVILYKRLITRNLTLKSRGVLLEQRNPEFLSWVLFFRRRCRVNWFKSLWEKYPFHFGNSGGGGGTGLIRKVLF